MNSSKAMARILAAALFVPVVVAFAPTASACHYGEWDRGYLVDQEIVAVGGTSVEVYAADKNEWNNYNSSDPNCDGMSYDERCNEDQRTPGHEIPSQDVPEVRVLGIMLVPGTGTGPITVGYEPYEVPVSPLDDDNCTGRYEAGARVDGTDYGTNAIAGPIGLLCWLNTPVC